MRSRSEVPAGSLAWAVQVLRRQGMPAQEIDAVLAEGPRWLHARLELHRERLQERLRDELRTLGRVEEVLSLASPERSEGPVRAQRS